MNDYFINIYDRTTGNAWREKYYYYITKILKSKIL